MDSSCTFVRLPIDGVPEATTSARPSRKPLATSSEAFGGEKRQSRSNLSEPPTGKLSYWPDDDGTLPVESLRDADAITLDTTEMALFDGARCHAVTAFEGGALFSRIFHDFGLHES